MASPRPITIAYTFRQGHVPRHNSAEKITHAVNSDSGVRAALRRVLAHEYNWAIVYDYWGGMYASVRRMKDNSIKITFYT